MLKNRLVPEKLNSCQKYWKPLWATKVTSQLPWKETESSKVTPRSKCIFIFYWKIFFSLSFRKGLRHDDNAQNYFSISEKPKAGPSLRSSAAQKVVSIKLPKIYKASRKMLNCLTFFGFAWIVFNFRWMLLSLFSTIFLSCIISHNHALGLIAKRGAALKTATFANQNLFPQATNVLPTTLELLVVHNCKRGHFQR